jgi:pimeloyl-ACP methyl ester carboxylesterase
MDIVLIAGLWLDGSAWDSVEPELRKLGHRGVKVTLPGQGDGSSSASYDDQVAAVVAAVDAAAEAGEPPLVVGHSAACTLAWAAADARADQVAGVVLIGGFPQADGNAYADFFEPTGDAVPFPGWEPFAGADSDDLDDELKARIAAGAHPVPLAVTRGTVRLADPRRYDLPVTLVCPEFSPAEAQEWIDSGDLPELAKATRLELVDIDSGHWPMFTRPAELAGLLAAAAR